MMKVRFIELDCFDYNFKMYWNWDTQLEYVVFRWWSFASIPGILMAFIMHYIVFYF